jgi:hypothetical protein
VRSHPLAAACKEDLTLGLDLARNLPSGDLDILYEAERMFGENQPLSAAGEMLRLTTLRIAKLECSRATPGIRDRCCLWMRS